MAKESLNKELRLLDVFCLATGAMISSGLFVLPGIAFAQAGPAVILSYGIACLIIIPAMLVQAELVTAMPKAGGTYVFIERSLGPLAGTFSGFLNWLSIALKAAFALIGLGAIAQQFFPDVGEGIVKLIAIAGCLVFTAINLVSVKGTGRLQVFLVLILLSILLLLVGGGASQIQGDRLFPFVTTDLHTVFAVAGLVFVSFGGLTKVASVGEEVVNPSRNLPLGMILAWTVVSLFYILVVLVTVGTVPAEQLSGSLVPVGLSAREVLGPIGMVLVDISAALAFITTANAGILSASRTPLAMSRDGLLPTFLSITNKRFGTPHTSIFLTSGTMIAVIALLSIEDLVKTASTIMILLFLFLNLAVITLRYSGIQSYQPPYRSPMFPYLPALSSILYGFLIFEMGMVPLAITAAFGFLSGFWYIFYVRPKIERESAFVHLVRSVTSRPLQRLELEDELRQISLERASPELSLFFQKLQRCPVLEIEESVDASEMYRRVSAKLSERSDLGADELFQLFIKREYESSTILHPGVSIPLIVTKRSEANEILLVRANEGVQFSELHQPVKAMFVFFGGIEHRNFYLKALMHLAHLVEEPDFLDRWLAATSEDQLRDVLLVNRRDKTQ